MTRNTYEDREETFFPDTAEQIFVSPLALLKMLRHGRAGVPLEVMGLMLGEFIDDYTISVVDVFSMPQSGNSVSVEAVDEAYQATMLEMLKRVGRGEVVVGWYHSHPGFGCWFSGTDVGTQQTFEQLNSRAVGIVVDPIQSVRGKVVIDCFRCIGTQFLMLGQEPRQTTANIGYINKPTITALVHGLNRHYYSININYKKNDMEKKMLLKIDEETQTTCNLYIYEDFKTNLESTMKSLNTLTLSYIEELKDELNFTKEQLIVRKAGKINSHKRIANQSMNLISNCLLQQFNTSIAVLLF